MITAKVYVSIDDTGIYNEDFRFAGTYLHGELETQNGYDIFAFDRKIELDEGAHDFMINNRPCTFFIWKDEHCHTREKNGKIVKYWRGYLIYKSDEAYEFCKKNFKKREQLI